MIECRACGFLRRAVLGNMGYVSPMLLLSGGWVWWSKMGCIEGSFRAPTSLEKQLFLL
jgi:hypothetical protein